MLCWALLTSAFRDGFPNLFFIARFWLSPGAVCIVSSRAEELLGIPVQRCDDLCAPLPPEHSESSTQRALPVSSAARHQCAPSPQSRRNNKRMAQDRWYAPAVPFVAGAVAGGTVKTFTAPLSRSTILLQTAGRDQLHTSGGALVQASQYLRHVSTTEGLRSFWKGNGVSILQKMATTGSNYFVYERLKEMLRFCWASSDDVGFKARLLCGTLAGAINVTVAYPLDLIRTNIASSHEAAARGSEWAGIVETASLLYRAHGLSGFARGLPATQLCQGVNIGLHFGIYETLNTNPVYRSAFERAMPRSWRTVDDDGRPRTSFAYSMVCGQCAGLVASSLVQPLDLVRRRQQLLGSGEGRVSFWRVASDLVRIGGVKELYRGLAPELCKVCLFPASGLNFYVYELVRQEVFGDRSGRR